MFPPRWILPFTFSLMTALFVRLCAECSLLGCIPNVQGCAEAGLEMTPWRGGRSLLTNFDTLFDTCPQGAREAVTQETMLNHHDWWEKRWGRTDASWPRRGMADCWANRGTECALPDRDHTVCLPGSRRGSTIAKGWALDPKSQACQPGVHCLYACEPGYYWTTFNQRETSNYDSANAHQKGHCDGTWDYGTSSHGVYCKEDGTLDIPSGKPLCQLGETYVYAENRLDTHVFLCQTVFPGHEIFLIPTLIRPGESVMITTQPRSYWHGPSYSSPTHGDFYVSFAGADIMEACTWDGFSPSGAALLPYEIGSGVENNGVVYSTHYFYQQPNSEVPEDHVGYQLDLECESSESGVCGPVFRANNVVKADVLKKPRGAGSTKVKFVFKKPHRKGRFGVMYREPARNHLHDPAWITGMSRAGPTPVATVHSGGFQEPTYQPQPGFHQQPPPQHVFNAPAGHASTHVSAVSTSNGEHHSSHFQQQNSGGIGIDGFNPNFNGANGSPPFQNGLPNFQGRRLKYMAPKSNIFLHNTLATPITFCSTLTSSPGISGEFECSGGDDGRSNERASSLGPGEKIQLDREAHVKISTEMKMGGSCGEYRDYHWQVVTGHAVGELVTYSYRQNKAPSGHALTLKCVSEDDDFCTSTDAMTISVPAASPETSAPSEITFIVKPSSVMSPATSETYVWGGAVQRFIKSLLHHRP